MVRLIVCFILLGCVKNPLIPQIPKTKKGTVIYSVSCSPAGFDVNYTNATNGSSQITVTGTTWTISSNGETNDYVYLIASSSNKGATISGRITFLGSTVDQASSSGDYALITVVGLLP